MKPVNVLHDLSADAATLAQELLDASDIEGKARIELDQARHDHTAAILTFLHAELENVANSLERIATVIERHQPSSKDKP